MFSSVNYIEAMGRCSVDGGRWQHLRLPNLYSCIPLQTALARFNQPKVLIISDYQMRLGR